MKRLVALAVLLGVVFFAPSESRAMSEELTTLYRQFKELYDQGSYAEAIPVVEKFLELGKIEEGLQGEAAGLIWLSWVYRDLGRYPEAEAAQKRVVAIFEKILDPDDQLIGTALHNLAELCRLQGRYVEAEPLYQRSLTIYTKAYGHNHSRVGTNLNNLSLLTRSGPIPSNQIQHLGR